MVSNTDIITHVLTFSPQEGRGRGREGERGRGGGKGKGEGEGKGGGKGEGEGEGEGKGVAKTVIFGCVTVKSTCYTHKALRYSCDPNPHWQSI